MSRRDKEGNKSALISIFPPSSHDVITKSLEWISIRYVVISNQSYKAGLCCGYIRTVAIDFSDDCMRNPACLESNLNLEIIFGFQHGNFVVMQIVESQFAIGIIYPLSN